MKKIIKNRKNLKVMLVTLLLLCSFSMISYKPSVSKYIDEKYNALHYSVNFKKMTGVSLISGVYTYGIMSSSTNDTIRYFYTFNRSGNMISTDNLDTYVITLNNYCTLDNISASNGIRDNNKISFASVGTELITVEFNCPVNNIISNNYIVLPMDVKEYFNNDNSIMYNYTSGTSSILLGYYNEQFPPAIPGDIFTNNNRTYIMPLERDKKKEGIINWFKLFAGTNGLVTYDEIVYYVRNQIDFDNITDANITLLNNVDGITVTPNSDNYTFNIDNKFTSYVKTYYKNHYYERDKEYYFYESGYDIDDLFLYYLDKYNIYSVNSDEYNIVKNYLTTEEIGEETVLDIASRNDIGLVYNSTNKYMTISNNLSLNIQRLIPVLSYTKTQLTGLKLVNLQSKLRTTILSTSLINQIVQTTDKNAEIYKSLNISNANTMFSTYTYLTDGVDNILVHIYSNDTTNTNVEIKYVDYNKDTIMEYEISTPTEDIIADLTELVNVIYEDSLVLEDLDTEIITKYNNLEDGIYNLNIGTLTIETTTTKKVTITLKEKVVVTPSM